jgi:hypothetical protein
LPDSSPHLESSIHIVDENLVKLIGMRSSGDLSDLLQTVKDIRKHLRPSLPESLRLFDSPNFLPVIEWLLTQPPPISSVTCSILTALSSQDLDGLATALLRSPLLDHLTSLANSEVDDASKASLRLLAALASSETRDLSFLFPLISNAFRPATAELLALFVYHQIEFLPQNPSLFERFRPFV